MANDSEVLRPLRRGEGLVRGRFETEHDGATYVVDAHYLDLDEHIRLSRTTRRHCSRACHVPPRRWRTDRGRGR